MCMFYADGNAQLLIASEKCKELTMKLDDSTDKIRLFCCLDYFPLLLMQHYVLVLSLSSFS